MQNDPLRSDQIAYSIRQFCQTVGISVRTFHALQQRGEGPPVVRIGRRTLIRRTTADEWLDARERSTSTSRMEQDAQ